MIKGGFNDIHGFWMETREDGLSVSQRRSMKDPDRFILTCDDEHQHIVTI